MTVPTTRHRLIPARGRGSHSWHAYGESEARSQAEAYAAENDTAVLVCSAPEFGLVKRLFSVPAPEKPKAGKT